MRIFLFNKKDEDSKRKFWQFLKDLPEEDVTYRIEIKRHKSVRTLSQNAYYHFILNVICTESEAGSAYTHDTLHDVCKQKFNYEVVEFPKTGVVLRGRSTTGLDSNEFTIFVNKVKAWAFDEFGVVIPAREDVDYIKWMNAENNYSKRFYDL